MSDFICTNCGKPCNAGTVDFGIGPYEYWGARGVDVRKAFVSDCCEADVTLDGKPYDEFDAREDAEADAAEAKYQAKMDERDDAREWGGMEERYD